MNERQSATNRRTLLFLPAKVVEGLVSVVTLSYLTGIYDTVVNSRFIEATTAMNLSYIILFAWLSNSASRYCGEYLLGGGKEARRAFFSTLLIPFLGISLLCGLLCGGLSLALRDSFFLLNFAMLFGYGAFQIFSIVLVQTMRALPYALLSVADAAGKLGLIWLLSRPGLFPPSAPGAAMAAYALTDLAVALAAAAICGLFTNFSLRAFSRPLFRTFFAYGYPLIGVSFSVAMLNMAYRFLLSDRYAGPGALAIYSNNATLATTVFTMLSVSLMRAAYPSILEAWRKEGAAAAQKSITGGMRNFLLIGIPAAFGLTAVSRDLSGLILQGEAYEAGAPAVGIVAFAMLFSGLTEYANKGWELSGNTRPILTNSLCCAAVNILLNLLLIPRIGFMSAAIVLFVSYLLYFLLSYFRSRPILRLIMPGASLARILTAGILCAAAAFALSLVPLSPVLRLALSIAAGGAVYIGVLALSGEIREELSAIHSILRRRKSA
ncbi:MAG: polysaccharide biosynthesis C-terminal domain-containing protein [Clostridia bacterium]|nr:polysaccharide biosynthesis C-terminal domain-containing protein [Clostridia bacterium]